MVRQPGSKGSLSHRMFKALVAACAGVALVVTVAASLIYQSAFLADEHDQLAGECRMLSSLLNLTDDDAAMLARLDLGDVRVTLIDPDGTVTYDSLADASELPSHADRPEVVSAFENGTGSSERGSDTVGYMSIYEAERLDSGQVVRLSVDRAGVMAFLFQDLVLLVLFAVVLVGASWLVTRWLSRRFVQPILEIDPSSGDGVAPYVELDPLVNRLNEQHAELVQRMSQIQDAADMRREFTANVTHELKTPIASISGAAELIRDGIAKPKDVPGFAGRIYDDARRLSSLVSDILTLSKLDETERAGSRELFEPSESVNLLAVARDVADRLASKARKAKVDVSVEGVSMNVRGNPRLLDELVSNLCDNAIRYNRPGGKVFVWVLPSNGGGTCLRVSDTGIGIPEASQDKVFERFYRVDKGRSRDMGGTGLGLAIVKHAAAYHGATVALESKVDKGTTITVTFPCA
ncbi:MAG TPA: two-component sensor histidine kinase [Candidatus Olsenella excrementigallinarum]|uniref:sensor histidine kinase n=1 Tax=Olsenella timonensis TaxID=1805478 RepID=UPI000A4A41D2|nr:ATP-binding protein [Olsenella timonensis]HJB48109.1 two-component sensor histidine kinase [Candidatus Olsenella excrementigallinarum]